jgi:hypothetical protein
MRNGMKIGLNPPGILVLLSGNHPAIAVTGSDLMELNEVARRIVQKNLERLRTDETFHDPVRDCHAVQLRAGLLNVLDSKRDMKAGRILLRTLRPGWRRTFRPHDVDLRCGFGLFPDVHPRAGHIRNFGACDVALKAEHLSVEPIRFLYLIERNPQSMMVEFENADGHRGILSPQVETHLDIQN